MSTHQLGPANGSLRVNTTRQGVAAKVGHDLAIEVQTWEATLNTDGADPTLELSADGSSLKVVDGHGGAKPLSDGDRKKIDKNIDKDVLGGKPIRFQSTGPGAGDLELAGTTRPAAFDLKIADDGTFTGHAKVVQSEWGIKPYSAMMGALKVADEVEIAIEGKLP